MSRLHGPGYRFRFGISMWRCACLGPVHQHPMLQLGSWRFVLRYPKCVRGRASGVEETGTFPVFKCVLCGQRYNQEALLRLHLWNWHDAKDGE